MQRTEPMAGWSTAVRRVWTSCLWVLKQTIQCKMKKPKSDRGGSVVVVSFPLLWWNTWHNQLISRKGFSPWLVSSIVLVCLHWVRHWHGGTLLSQTLGVPQYCLPPSLVWELCWDFLGTKHPGVISEVDTSLKTKWICAAGQMVRRTWSPAQLFTSQAKKKKRVQKQAQCQHNIILESPNAFAYREYPIYL